MSKKNEDAKKVDDTKKIDDTKKNDDTKKMDDSKKTDDTKKEGGNKTLLITEAVIALVAVAIIIVAIVVYNKPAEKTGTNDSGNVASAGTDGTDATVSAIDNSVLFENTPEIPDITSVANMTEEEALKAVEDGTMIVLTTGNSKVYVNNYQDHDYFFANTPYDESDIDKIAVKQVLLPYFAETKATTRTVAQLYDTVSINYIGRTMDGVAFDGGTANDQTLQLGSGSYIDGFEDGVIGMSVGETKTISVTFPEDYGAENLAGQDATFEITLNSIISETTLPELTDQMLQEVSGDSTYTVERFREEVKEGLMQDAIWEFIDGRYYVDKVSEEDILSYYNESMEYYDSMCQSYGMPIEELLGYYGTTIDELKSDAMESAVENAQYTTMYKAIAEANGITVTDEDITTLATDYGYTDNALFLEDYGEDNVKYYILQSNIMDYFISIR